MFESANPSKPKENYKARVKNHNLPILQHIYMGSPDTPLRCLLTGTPAFISVPCWGSGQDKTRFRLDFNHIRQRCNANRHAGISVDKGQYDPSALLRSKYLDDDTSSLLEFLTIMPICTEAHAYITQDSSKYDITLKSFSKDTWPWALQSAKNWYSICKHYKLEGLKYTDWIDHLSDITHKPINARVYRDYQTQLLIIK